MADTGYLKVLHGLDAVRRRPAMYLGEATAARLYVVALAAVLATPGAEDRSTCTFTLLRGGGCTIEVDVALASDDTSPEGGIEQPRLVHDLLRLSLRPTTFLEGVGPILVALCAALDVRGVRAGRELRAAFGRGGLVTPVSLSPTTSADLTVFELLPDPSLLTGEPTLDEIERRWAEVAAERGLGPVRFVTSERAVGEVPWSSG